MSTLYHTSYSSLVLNAPAGPEKTLSVLVLFPHDFFEKFCQSSFLLILRNRQRTSTLSVFSGPAGAFSTREL